MENLAIRLEGDLVVLEPFERRHADELWEAAQAPQIWAWFEHFGASRELRSLVRAGAGRAGRRLKTDARNERSRAAIAARTPLATLRAL